MKHLFTLLVLTSLICLPCLAQNQPPTRAPMAVGAGRGPAGPQIRVTADHADWKYVPGEPVKFTLSGPAGTTVNYAIGPEMMPAESKSAVIPENGALVLDGGTMNEPGFLRCVATAVGGGRDLATAGFAPEKIKPTQTEPADFDAFWAKAKAELAAIPMDAKLTPMPQLSNDKAEAFEVDLQNVGTPPATTSRFYGILYIPHGDGPFPAILSTPGAGVRGPDRDSIWHYAERGFIVLYVGIHEMRVVPVQGAAPTALVPGNYTSIGLDNPDHYYFRRVLMGCVRANDYLVTLPKWDRKNLVAVGGSQGGYLAITTTGLDPRVTACAVSYPAFCDATGYLHNRPAGWPAFKFNDTSDPQRDAKIATTAYFDGVNFAKRIKVPGHYGWGYNDETCPPDSTFSAFNVITAPKKLAIFKEMTHLRIPAMTEAEDAWLFKHVSQGVTVSEDPSSFTMSNGIVTAKVSRRNSDLTSLQFKGMEMLEFKSGHPGGYWSHDTTGGADLISKVTIDPKSNGGERAEVSVKGISGGRKMGHGAGAAADGDFPADIEIRYSLGRGESGVYTYCTFEHQADYPAATMTEARYCAKVATMFDWMTMDDKRNMSYPADLHEGDKYMYTAVQYDHPVYGWSSTTKNVGFWLVNPSMEYLSGGPTKVEFLCHRDTTAVAAGCIHNYWRSSHYGAAAVEVGQGEHWTKVIGPFFLYLNSASDPQAMWSDAKAYAAKEVAKWPYEWVAGVDYPHRNDRATVKGQLVLNDPQMPNARTPNLLVGLTQATYASPYTAAGRGGGPGVARQIDWQTDAKNYQFWARGDDRGNFAVPNVRAGKYTLRAMADGVLGEYAKADVTVESGKTIDLGKLDWQPVRRGRQLWDVGIPNRTATEFFKGDEFADPEISLKYATLMPNDVNYVIGKSDFRKDWFFQQVPHNISPNAQVVPYSGVRGNGRATPFAVTFDLPSAPRGKATLRLAICGTGARTIDVTVNDQAAGQVALRAGDGAITRHSIQGIWYEREMAFDAAMMKRGTNVLKLIVPAGPINNGVIYDYVRLELDESAPAAP